MVLNKIIKIVLRQYNTGTWLGWFQSVYGQVQGNLGTIQFIIITVMAWGSNIGSNLREIFPWMNFTLYIIAFILGSAILMLLNWKLVYPSIVLLSNQQGYQHGSPIKADFETVNSEIELVKKDISEIKKMVETIAKDRVGV